ncbi:MAG: hypothetical protein MI806_16520 [Minwuiales bacterium]|nr:hypothetical protein [Minwuiales bacterium]
MLRKRNSGLKGVEARAEKGEPDAQFDLGLMYSTGQQVQQDYINAHKWFNLAALNGSDRARMEREELAEIMSAAEIAEAQRLAREWKLSH